MDALGLMRGVAFGAPDSELLGSLLALFDARLPGAPIAIHVRDISSNEWRLAGELGLSNEDASLLASLVSPPEPLALTRDLPDWTPLFHRRAPWRGLSPALEGACLVAPARFADGTIAGSVTFFASTSDDVACVAEHAGMLLWVARSRGRHYSLISGHEARYAALAEYSPDSIWRLDAQNRIAYVNREYERVAGTTANALIGRHAFDALPATAHDAWRGALAEIAPGKTSEVIYASGGRHYSARLAPEIGADGRVVGTVATIRDITERFRWAAELEAVLMRAQIASELTRSVVYDRTLQDESAYVSPSMRTVFGYDPVEVKEGGLAWWIDRVHADDRKKFASMFSAHGDGATTEWTVEYRVAKSDGSWATVLDQGRLLTSGEDGAPVRCIGVVTDVTALRALQAQVHHSHRIELIGRLAGGVAHDFNNVLAAIGGFTELLLHSTPPTDARTADLLEIATLVRRGSGLTANLLGISRRRDQSQPIVIDIGAAVLRLAPTLRTLLGPRVGLEIESIAEALTVRMDPGHFDQVVLNLAVNARDAMPDGGVVSIDARLKPAAEGERPSVLVEVSDRGLGIPPDVLEKIFQPFFTTKSEGHGTGLGLSVVNDIVQSAGGSISVASTTNVGTTFTVRLPLSKSAVTPTGMDAITTDLPARGGTVLLIEDEEAIRRSTRRILEREGFSVIEARTGDAGLAALLAHRERIDAIVSDLYMPGLSGPALIERLRREAPEIGCLVVSGHAERFAKLEPKPGALIIVTKPCRGPTLVEHVGDLVRATRTRRTK